MAATGSLYFTEHELHLLAVTLRVSMTPELRDEHMTLIKRINDERSRRNEFTYANRR